MKVLPELMNEYYLNKSLSDHRVFAHGAVEAVVVPGQRLEGHELRAAEAAFA